MNRHLAYLIIIGLTAWLAGMIIHRYQSQPVPPTAVASQKIGWSPALTTQSSLGPVRLLAPS